MQLYEQLEHGWAAFNDLDPAGMVACSSGTAALHLALEAMQLPLGSNVIVPDLTMIACPRAVTLAGLTPVFVDCDDTLNMDPQLLNQGDKRLGEVVMAVHIYGRRCNMDEIVAGCFNNGGAYLIEDLAEAHGIKPHEETDAATWSYYRNKIIHGEEGGAVWFRDPSHAALARQLRTLGFTDAHDFNHTPRGHNYRMSNVHAGLVLDSLVMYEANLRYRRAVEMQLDAWCPPEWRMPPRQAPWVYDLRIGGMMEEQQTVVVKALQAAGIAARHCFKSCTDQEEYKECKAVFRYPPGPMADSYSSEASREVIYLPLDRSYETDPFEVVKRILG